MSKFKKLNESASYEDYKKQHKIESPAKPAIPSTVTGKAIEVEKTDTPKEYADHCNYKKPTEPYTLEKFAAIVNGLSEKHLGKGASADHEATPKATKIEVKKHTEKVNESDSGEKDLATIISMLKKDNPDLTNEQLLAKAQEEIKVK